MSAASDGSDATPTGGGAGANEGARSRVRWLLLALATFLVIFLRSPEVLLFPSLEAEDGTFVFQYFYTHRDLAEIFRFKSGYIPLVANAIAYLSVRLPTRAIPYGFAWVPLALTIVTYTWLFGERFRAWLGSDVTRAVLCFLFALAPLAQWHLLSHTDYSIWNTLLLLVFLSVLPWPESPWRRCGAWVAANILVWSHPLTILVAPVFLYRVVRDRRHLVLDALVLCNLLLHQLVGVQESGVFAGMSLAEAVGKLARSAANTCLVVGATAFRAAFGPEAHTWAESQAWIPVVLWSAGILVAAGVAARRSPRVRTVVGVLAYVVVTISFLSVLVRDAQGTEQFNTAPRYVYLPTLAFLALYVLLVDYWVGRWRDRAGEAISAGRARPRDQALVAAFGLLLAWHVVLNARMGHFFVWTSEAARPPGGRWSVYVQSHPDNGRIVRDFFAALANAEAATGSREGINLVANKHNDWPITIGERPGRRRR
jgi:hypothetical protein